MNRTNAVLAVVSLATVAGSTAALAGCATARPQAASSPAARPAATASAAPGSAAPGSATTFSAPPAATSAPPASAPVPTLGRLAGLFVGGQGFGQVEPARIFNGGDPTGLVTKVVWTSWGGPEAVATGVSEWVGPGQSVATGTPEPVRVVAFRLGVCGGKPRYRALEWYFPQHGQHFDAGRYEDICKGAYVPAA